MVGTIHVRNAEVSTEDPPSIGFAAAPMFLDSIFLPSGIRAMTDEKREKQKTSVCQEGLYNGHYIDACLSLWQQQVMLLRQLLREFFDARLNRGGLDQQVS
jgi:hypothetical protein